VQVPRHSGKTHGTFSLRSPARPNPIALSVVRILKVDADTGRIDIDAIDCHDGTPLVDIKPYRPGIDAVPDATTP
jgi:tRNA (adenine37-N6)-methyltransferase